MAVHTPIWAYHHIINLFLLSAAIEWAIETYTFLSQLFEISLYPAVPRDL